MTAASLRESGGGLPGGVRGAADSHFVSVIKVFTRLFPGAGKVPWSADTGAMVFSATKAVASTVIHRLVDNGLLDYDVARRRVLARLRGERQVGHHGSRRVASPKRTVAPQGCRQERVDGSPSDGEKAGRGTGRPPSGRARVPRTHLRLAAVGAGEVGDR